MRKAEISRKTKETEVFVSLNIDGCGKYKISTGIHFLNHMLELFSKHSLVDLEIQAKGDLNVDFHHTVEDVGIVLGQAVSKALDDRKGIFRFGDAIVPMDEALTLVSLDLSNRGVCVCDIKESKEKVGDFDSELVVEFFRAFAVNAGLTLHIKTLSGSNMHHIFESSFKALAISFRKASAFDPLNKDIPSVKGLL